MPGTGSTEAARLSRNIASLRSRTAMSSPGKKRSRIAALGWPMMWARYSSTVSALPRSARIAEKAAWCRWSVSTRVPSRSKRSAITPQAAHARARCGRAVMAPV